MDPVITLMECEHSFCRDCIQQAFAKLSPTDIRQCPFCKVSISNAKPKENEKLGAISASIRQFCADFCDEAGLAAGTWVNLLNTFKTFFNILFFFLLSDEFIGKATSPDRRSKKSSVGSKGKGMKPPSAEHLSPAPVASPSFSNLRSSNLMSQMKADLQNTPEPRQKVHQWLVNVEPSTAVLDTDEDERTSVCSKASKDPSVESRPSSSGALLESFQDLIGSKNVHQVPVCVKHF